MKNAIKFKAFDKQKRLWYKNVLPLSDSMFLIEDINGLQNVVTIPDFIDTRAPIEFEIVQFTGLIDTNKTEIYRGDIVETETGLKFEVRWSTEGAAFRYVPIELSHSATIIDSESPLNYDHVKVIGNIYDN